MANLKSHLFLAAAFAVLAMSIMVMESQKAHAEKPDTPVSLVAPLPLPVTGNVQVTGSVQLTPGGSVNIANPASNPVPVQQGIAKRYNLQLADTSGNGDVVVPPVPAGQTFIVTSFSAIGFSNVATPLTGGACATRLSVGGSTIILGAMPVQVNGGVVVANETTFLPLSADESLRVFCFSQPGNSFFTVAVGGYFVPAS
jgi:hypothetical protein